MAAPLYRKITVVSAFRPIIHRSFVLTRKSSSQTDNGKNNASRHKAIEHHNDSSSLTHPNNGRLGHFMQMYEDFVGLTEVKLAQAKVVDAETQFLDVQEDRRARQQDLVGIQTDVRSVANELEKTHRTDPGYIDLVKREHEILLIEKDMNSKIKALDKAERDFFSLLSAAVRESHEKERARAERTKYWSVIGSVIGALIGITGSTWNNRVRLKEMRAIVTESKDTALEYKEVASKLLSGFSFLQNVGDEDLSFSIDSNNNNNNSNNNNIGAKLNKEDTLHEQTEVITSKISQQADLILSHLNDVKRILSVKQGDSSQESVIYVGPEISQMLDDTKTDLKRDSFKNMVCISVLGCFLTVGLSLFVGFIKGS